ncbi:MAG: glucans biosynthesis glucosyltransferase MdoH, partial [Pseudomonadota bacterium]
WIAFAACSALAGFLLARPEPDLSKSQTEDWKRTRTALLMPVYNEDPCETCAALFSMGSALAKQGLSDQFEIFIISDTKDPNLWVKEIAAVNHLKRALFGQMNVWYRRRHDNRAKKAGNVQEFITRWGGRYDFMVVLDADSLLSASTLCTLVKQMAADNKSGIIQTLPCLYRGTTLFARLQQFAGAIYGPIVARGITAWQGNDGNYWGHNAIIRVRAFAASAGLPTLGGIRPFAGDVLSHDFVEAALMRRAGWKVRMLPTLKGSWEESPPSLSDVAIRDRRWAQGNIQHIAVLHARGLRWLNRFHMITGVMGYLASPFWFALILVGIGIGIQIQFASIDYFTDEVTLFPNWPVFDSERMVKLFVLTMSLLLVPKALGLLRAFFTHSLRKPLGIIRMSLGTVVEIFFSILYAPIFMLIHCQHVFDIFRGKDAGWAKQHRHHAGTNWGQLCKQHFWHTCIGIAMLVVLYFYSPLLIVWLSPIITGLILSIPLSALSGSHLFAKWLRWLGLLSIPEEVQDIDMFKQRDAFVEKTKTAIIYINLETLIENCFLQKQHFSLVQAPPPVNKGDAPIDYLSADYKINQAASIFQAIAWMTDKEKIAVLSHRSLMGKISRIEQVQR